MITQRVYKIGNSFMVAIPQEEVERQHIGDGDAVSVTVRKVSSAEQLSPDERADRLTALFDTWVAEGPEGDDETWAQLQESFDRRALALRRVVVDG
jgi:antitoxin component of MazEF toxin-antitoxin module